MSVFFKKLQSVYENAYFENEVKKFTDPKIYHGGKDYDLSKRWYVYYSYIDPETGKMTRQTPVTLKVNRRFKTKNDRLKHLNYIRSALLELLKAGYSPYKSDKVDIRYTAVSCLDYALKIKKKEVKATTYKDYQSRINQFKDYLNTKRLLNESIKNISKKHITDFLSKYEGAKTRNNCKNVLSSIFKVLSDENYIETNFIKEIRNKKVIQNPVRIYSEDEINNIIELLEKYDQTLLMFIYFVSYMFWRPIEIVRIKRSDIDLKNGIISIDTKTKALKKKIIPELLAEKIVQYLSKKEGFIFEPDGSDWNKISEIQRRDYYTKKFAKFRSKFNISSDLKLYSFRHTFITKIYSELRKSFSKEETIKQLSLITGHESKAIHNYIMINDIELPDDYSHLL